MLDVPDDVTPELPSPNLPLKSSDIFPRDETDAEGDFFKEYGIRMPELPEQFPHLPPPGPILFPTYGTIKSQLAKVHKYSHWTDRIVPQYLPHVEFPNIKHIADDNFVTFKRYIYMFCEFADVFRTALSTRLPPVRNGCRLSPSHRLLT